MPEPTSAGGPLDDSDLVELARLLARYAEHELDQFDHWCVRVPGAGTIFVEVANEPRPDVDRGIYVPIWPLPSRFS